MNDHLEISRKLLLESTYVPACRNIVELLIEFLTSDEGKEGGYTFILSSYGSEYAESMAVLHLAITQIPNFNFSCIGPEDEVREAHGVLVKALSELGDITEFTDDENPTLH